MAIQRIFGKPEPSRHYPVALGVYALLLNASGLLALIRKGSQVSLPGSELCADTPAESQLLQSLSHQHGLDAHVLWHLAETDQYPSHPHDPVCLQRSQFYLAELDTAPAAEAPELAWLSPAEALQCADLPASHAWMIQHFSAYLTA